MAALEQELASAGINGHVSHNHQQRETTTQDDEYLFDKYDYSSFIVERPTKARIVKLCFLYVLSTTLLIASMASSVNYLVYKFRLYIKEIHSAATAPWLLLILLCEVLYCISNFIAAIDYFLPPNLRRPGLLLPKYDEDEEEGETADNGAPNGHANGASHGHANGHSNGHPNGRANGAVKRPFVYPKVDIFLPCCKEPTEVPQESIIAALAMDYPRHKFRVIVLDDGGDDDLKAFCEAYEMERGGKEKRLVYLRRKKIPGVPHHFKCGNLNFGLEHSDADFVVMMDADMILHPTLFRRLLPHLLCSPKASFAQIPQSFYNLPRGDPLNDACGFGYDRVMIHRDIMGCANCVGTGAIFRRKHIDEIGGFQPQSITEDTMTAFILFNRGYESIYLNEKLQIGLVPWTFEAYIKQRQRWGQGAIQQFLATWKSMLGPKSKLNFFKKACYFWHTGYYYMSTVNILLALTLLCSLAFNLRLTVGDENENRTLVLYLAIFLVTWRILWYSLWLEVPQAIQSRNRDESQFWWMTPFFFQMVVKAAWDMKSTFKFVPTSNIDRRVNNKKKGADGEAKPVSCVTTGCNDIKVMRVHIIFVVLALAVVLVRIYIAFGRHEVRSCRETFVLIGLSFFVIPVCFHMMVPVFHILWGTGYKPEQRKSLLKYSQDGVAQFDPKVDCLPKFHWSIVFFELMSYATLAFWAVVLYYTHSRSAYRHVDRFCYGRL